MPMDSPRGPSTSSPQTHARLVSGPLLVTVLVELNRRNTGRVKLLSDCNRHRRRNGIEQMPVGRLGRQLHGALEGVPSLKGGPSKLVRMLKPAGRRLKYAKVDPELKRGTGLAKYVVGDGRAVVKQEGCGPIVRPLLVKTRHNDVLCRREATGPSPTTFIAVILE